LTDARLAIRASGFAQATGPEPVPWQTERMRQETADYNSLLDELIGFEGLT
jgi:hypothetical protein